METTELETNLYRALTEDENLIELLPHGDRIPIFHLFAPAGDSQQYPILVYAPTSDVPVDYGDDEELFHRVTIRISIITTNGEYDSLNRAIRHIMVNNLGFKRIQTVPTVDFEYEKIILNCDYQITIES